MKNNVEYTQITPNIHLFHQITDGNLTWFRTTLSSAGAYFETKGMRGVSHLLEHCCVTRTKDKELQQLNKYLFENEIYRNASTGRLFMYFDIDGHKDDTEKMFELLNQFVFDPYFTQDVLNDERKVVLQEIMQKVSSPGYRLSKSINEKVFTEDSFELCEILGDVDDVNSATLDLLQKSHVENISKSHIVFEASGSEINKEDLIKKILRATSKYKFEPLHPVSFLPKNTLREFKFLPIVSELAHDEAAITIVLPYKYSMAYQVMQVYFNELMFRSESSYLYNKLRNELGLVYSLSNIYDSSSETLRIQLVCQIKDVNRVVDEVKNAFDNFDNIFDESKITTVRNIVVKKQEISEDNPRNTINFMVDTFLDYDQIINYSEYTKLIQDVNSSSLKNIFNEIKSELPNMKMIVISNNSKINELSF